MVAQMEAPKYGASLEVRKLPPSVVGELAKILDDADLWKRLMSVIPRKLSSTSYRSDITSINTPKYTSEHFKIIEKGGEQYRRSCTEILLDEWGTSGRPRANLGHLKYLLVKAQLFRAADYVAKLLGENPPTRPKAGPAAPIAISLADLKPEEIEVQHHLDEINYPQVALQAIRKNSLEVKHNVNPVIPEIVVSEDKPIPELPSVPLVVPKPKSQEIVVSDMMKFSDTIPSSDDYDVSEVVLPECSIFDVKNPNLPQSSASVEEDTEFIPVFSQLLPDNNKLSQYALNSTQSSNLPDLDQLLDHATLSKSNSNFPTHSDGSNYSESSDIPLTIPQPDSWPKTSFSTELPHFSYSQLEVATKNFSTESGTFLGAGAFGSVFLATELFDTPVAVKKMSLDNAEGITKDEIVTKQFKNEVEIFSKCKHENLVPLLGYSCDGPTYCLVYEYVAGGSLFDVLQKNPEKLLWQQRVHIALGTSRGIAYLHNLPTPLIHRDIKSANILLDNNNNAKVCDFGIIKPLPGEATDLTTAPCGTSAYMSPEYHRGEVSVKLDSFSFGVVLLELLTSLPPVDYDRDAADLVTYAEDHCEESIDPILDRNVGNWEANGLNFAEELYNIALKCLEDERNRLFMTEVANLLENLQNKLSA